MYRTRCNLPKNEKHTCASTISTLRENSPNDDEVLYNKFISWFEKLPVSSLTIISFIIGMFLGFLLWILVTWIVASISNITFVKSSKTHEAAVNIAKQLLRQHHLGYFGEGYSVNVSSLYVVHKQDYQEGLEEYGFNKYVSDRISVQRPLPDYRSKLCQKWALQQGEERRVSIIISFYNEAWSTLLRTIYSIMNNTPKENLLEVILVNDASNNSDFRSTSRLESYVVVPKHWEKKVKVLNTPTHYGVSKARMLGVNHSSGAILVFLQSHVECTTGWLEPLINRVILNPHALAVPLVDDIDYMTFQYIPKASNEIKVDSINWALQHVKRFSLETDFRDSVKPSKMPVIGDGMFAVNKTFFMKLGGFDEALTHMLAESTELSIRAWLCGGSIVLVPCSRVGHVNRQLSPLYNKMNDFYPRFSLVNTMRISEVWLDKYKDLVYDRIPLLKLKDIGKLNKQIELRRSLKCRNFSWYLKNVEPALFVPESPTHHGVIQLNVLNTTVLTLSVTGSLVFVDNKPSTFLNPPIVWSRSNNGQIMTENNTCLTSQQNQTVGLDICGVFTSDHSWLVSKFGTIQHARSRTCLTAKKLDNKDAWSVRLEACNGTREDNFQSWRFPTNKMATFIKYYRLGL